MVENNTLFAVVCVLLVVVAGVLLYWCDVLPKANNDGFANSHQNHKYEDEYEPFENAQMQDEFVQMNEKEEEVVQNSSTPSAAEEATNEVSMSLDETAVSNTKATVPKDCFPKDQLTPQELLPADTNSTWAQVNPAGQANLGDQNFLTAGHHVGVNTVGQTLRNANLQLRSEPPNPQMKVSPWMQSTIEPDTNRRPMEISGC